MRSASLAAVSVLALTSAALGNHGPGTSGGSSSVVSGETLKPGTWEFMLRFDATEFEHVSREEAEARAEAAGEFDALRRSLLSTLSVNYGVAEDFQAGIELGYYAGRDFIDAHFHEEEEETESAVADPAGLSDLWINLKYRVHRGESGHVAVFGGIKLPTGKHDVRLDDGDELEPSSQPGTGSLDLRLGVAFSRFLTYQLSLDASAAYTHRTPSGDFKVGDRFDAGVGVSYRVFERVNQFPNFAVFGEATLVWLGEDASLGEENQNSGGTTVYLGAGVRVRLSERVALTVSPSVPVIQDLNGDQVETRFKLMAGLSFTF